MRCNGNLCICKPGVFVCIFLFSILWIASGCSSGGKPRIRGSSFGGIIGDYFFAAEDLGVHQKSEHNGFVYTCRGGFIDIGHVREAADRTVYTAAIMKERLTKGDTEFVFESVEPSRYYVRFEYPEGWDTFAEKDEVAEEIAIELGQYFAHMSTVWHEIITWFGFSCTGFFSEHVSSFSWEDTYSDLIGTHLAVRAMRREDCDYSEAMTDLIYDELLFLDAQSTDVARLANDKVYGDWYTGAAYFFTRVKKRSFDTGLGDNEIAPILVEGMCDDCEPQRYRVPDLGILEQYGFSMEIQIDPRISEKYAIYRILYHEGNGQFVVPDSHFPILIHYIESRAAKLYGNEMHTQSL